MFSIAILHNEYSRDSSNDLDLSIKSFRACFNLFLTKLTSKFSFLIFLIACHLIWKSLPFSAKSINIYSSSICDNASSQTSYIGDLSTISFNNSSF